MLHVLYLTVSPSFVLQFMAANTAMQGAYIPQYAHMQTSAVPVEVRAFPRLTSLIVAKVELAGTDFSLLSFSVPSRKMVHRHKWTQPAIIPHIPTNRASSAAATFGRQLKQSWL